MSEIQIAKRSTGTCWFCLERIEKGCMRVVWSKRRKVHLHCYRTLRFDKYRSEYNIVNNWRFSGEHKFYDAPEMIGFNNLSLEQQMEVQEAADHFHSQFFPSNIPTVTELTGAELRFFCKLLCLWDGGHRYEALHKVRNRIQAFANHNWFQKKRYERNAVLLSGWARHRMYVPADIMQLILNFMPVTFKIEIDRRRRPHRLKTLVSW